MRAPGRAERRTAWIRPAVGGAAVTLVLALAACGTASGTTISVAGRPTAGPTPTPAATAAASMTLAPPTGSPAQPTASPSAAPADLAANTAVLPRSTVDRPDEHAGNQVHVVYAIPADGQDRHRDTDGEIVRSVHAMEEWLRVQTGGGVLRVDTALGGALDITFVRLPESDAALAALGAGAVDHIEADLTGLGFFDPLKVYAVYYDGGDNSACGSTPTPGSVAAEYLDGIPPGAPPCDTNPVGASADVPGYIDFGMLHEIVHALGFVADCAPHSTGNNHVDNNPHDLMYAGDQPWDPTQLDPAHTDYFRTQSRTCPDLADSPYLSLPSKPRAVPTPVPSVPTAASGACSPSSSQAAVITFVNSSATETLDVFWDDFQCHEESYASLAPHARQDVQTFVGHIWHVRLQSSGALVKTVTATAAAQTVTAP